VPFYTFSFEHRRWRPYVVASVVFLGGLAVGLGSLEFFARNIVPRMSRIEGRMVREYTEALACTKDEAREVLLLVGNSQLDEGVEMGTLGLTLGPRWEVRRFPIEQTAFYDWRYGILRLAGDGCRLKVFGLVLAPAYVVEDAVRGEYSASYLLRAHDVLALGRELRLHPTQMCDLLLGTFSRFYAVRIEVRKVLLGRLVPNMGSLVELIRPPVSGNRDYQTYYRVARDRLGGLRAAGEAKGIRVLLILHPSAQANDGTQEVVRAAHDVGMEVIAVGGARFSSRDFRDGHHLNESGARRFTAALAPALSRVLNGVDRE
jgi:hypothetical protein